MGAAWCRERIEHAQNSKSPVDRIITRCSNAINAKTIYTKQNQSKPANDIVFKQIRYATAPAPVHQAPPPRTHARSAARASAWQDATLRAASSADDVTNHPAPVPPPRKRRRRKVNSLEVLNSQLDMIYESSYHHKRRPKSELLFGDPLPTTEDPVKSSDSSPERGNPAEKSANSDSKRKFRARKIMESKTKKTNKDTSTEEKSQPPKMVKNISAISLPCNYGELGKEEKSKPPPPKRNASAVSLPGESVITALSGVTMQRLESYLRRCKSFGSLKPQQLLERLEEITNKQDEESSDSWSGLDDWDLGIIEYCDAEDSEPPLVPKSRLMSKQSSKVFELGPPAEDKPFPPTPPPFHREMSRDNTFDMPHPTHDWFSSESINSSKLNPVKTPPPTPEEKKVEEPKTVAIPDTDDYSHSTLLKILRELPKQMSEIPVASTTAEDESATERVPTPTPPRRRSRDDGKRRQSYQDVATAPKSSQLLLRSMSVDATIDEISPSLQKTWHNISFSSSRHSLQQALVGFLGFDESPAAVDGNSEPEVNLNSSLFPVIGLKEDKEPVTPTTSPSALPTCSPSPSPPPPLPSSPPPIQSASAPQPLVDASLSNA